LYEYFIIISSFEKTVAKLVIIFHIPLSSGEKFH